MALYTGVSQAVFSHEYEPDGAELYHSDMGYANTALIGGEGEGAPVSCGYHGRHRRSPARVFVDAKDLGRRTSERATGRTLPGQSKLSTLSMLSAFDAEVNHTGTCATKRTLT